MKNPAGDATRIEKQIVAPDLKTTPPSELEASSFFHKLTLRLRTFEAALDAGDELLLMMPSVPDVRFFQIGKNGEVFYFSGEDSEGRSVMVIQHYTQVTVMLIAVPPPKGESPRRIGFLEDASSP